MKTTLFDTVYKLQEKLLIDYNDAIHLFNEFSIKYRTKHKPERKPKSYYNQRDKVWEKYANMVYIRPVDNFHKFLNNTNLEEQIIGHAANGDSNWTAHWIRSVKDVVKMYRNTPRESYNRIKDDYFTIKKEAEELLGERLQL